MVSSYAENMVNDPIIVCISDDKNALDNFENFLHDGFGENGKFIMNFPTIYIHNWRENLGYEVYVGESNNIFQRTRQHFDESANENAWQHNILSHKASLYIIGHEHFNKSLTLAIENQLIQYMLGITSVKRVYNGRGNPQNMYYPDNEFEAIFNKIWENLGTKDPTLFPSITTIKDSAVFKASPLHKLTEDQENAKALIIKKVKQALDNDEKRQLVFIDGEAGTGKTVLNSSTFYDLCCDGRRCCLLVNHDEQITVYKQISDKLGLTERYGEVVCKPTSFINNQSVDDPIDVAFIDEAHLLLTQGKQSYRGRNQLADVIDRARITIVMFDENQILTTEQYWESELLETYRNRAKELNNHLSLTTQLRMQVDLDTLKWIDSFTKDRTLGRIPKNSKYLIRIFDTPKELDEAITDLSKKKESKLSRLIATYDWEYSSKSPDVQSGRYWEVQIEDWHKPWNRELEKELSREEKKRNKSLAWAEQPQTIGEVGSTFTIQGFDLNYAGVILGPSVKYRDGRIVFDPRESRNEKAVQNRTLNDGRKQSFGKTLIQHEVRVLMTRGVNGLFIYACDPELRQALKDASL